MSDQAIYAPDWLLRDLQRQARWLPNAIKSAGLDGAFQQRWTSLPGDIQGTIAQMDIPSWMIALVPVEAEKQDEILKQFRFISDLAGDPPVGPIAARAEQLLIFGGAAQLPTPGDSQTGASLGPEGCTAAISKYVISELLRDYSQELSRLPAALSNCQSSVRMQALFQQAEQAGAVAIENVPFARLTAAAFHPGDITIAQKPGGTHVFAWTRVPAGWGWDPSDKMAIGNTGLPQYGDRMILAQEYVTGNPGAPGELEHNEHGPIDSTNVVDAQGQPDLSDPRTNVYAVRGSNFIIVRFTEAVTA